MPDVARLHTAYVWVPGGYGDRTNGLCINQTHGPHHWALQMTPVGQIDIHLQHAFLGVSGGSFGSQGVPFGSIHLGAHKKKMAGGDVGHYGPANRPNGPDSAAVLSHTPHSDLRPATHPPGGPPAARIGFSCCSGGSGRWHSAGVFGLQGGMQAGNCPREVQGHG